MPDGYSPDYYRTRKETFKAYRETWYTKNPTYVIWHNAKRRAKEAGYAFDIDWRDLTIPDVCPVLGIPIVKGQKKSSDNSPSIDKVIPSLGYVKGNVRIISSRANRLKSDATLQELQALVRYLSDETD